MRFPPEGQGERHDGLVPRGRPQPPAAPLHLPEQTLVDVAHFLTILSDCHTGFLKKTPQKPKSKAASL